MAFYTAGRILLRVAADRFRLINPQWLRFGPLQLDPKAGGRSGGALFVSLAQTLVPSHVFTPPPGQKRASASFPSQQRLE